MERINEHPHPSTDDRRQKERRADPDPRFASHTAPRELPPRRTSRVLRREAGGTWRLVVR